MANNFIFFKAKKEKNIVFVQNKLCIYEQYFLRIIFFFNNITIMSFSFFFNFKKSILTSCKSKRQYLRETGVPRHF